MPTEFGRRSVTLMVLVVLGAAALLGQLANLTVRQRDQMIARIPVGAMEQYTVEAPRGNIVTRGGEPLAMNRPASVVYISYPYYRDPAVLNALAEILEMDTAELIATGQRRAVQGPLWVPLRVKSDISAEQHARILEEQTALPGVSVTVEPVRRYPQGNTAGHITGYVGALTAAEWDRLQPGKYRPDDMIGKTGLEAAFEDVLRGRSGVNRVRVNMAWVPVGAAETLHPPTQGSTIVVSLDLKLQKAAEAALAWTIFRIANTSHRHGKDPARIHGARAGAMVVLDVKTGAVLAMASYPDYDPNLFITRRPPAEYARIQTDPLAPQWNRAINSMYLPGSTFKMVTATAGLGEGVMSPMEKVLSTAIYEPTKQAESGQGGYGPVNMRQAIQKSSNVYFYEVGRRVGADRLEKYARMYGFGSRTGLDLKEEIAGYVPTKEQRATMDWYLHDTTSTAIGQIFEVTPLQLAVYAAAIANGGKVMRPHLVSEIVRADGSHQFTAPEILSEIDLSPELLRVIQEGMQMVDQPGGTSDMSRWPLPGLITAGKTGTAEYNTTDDNGLFVGYAPADDPEIAVAVVIERAGHGSFVGPAVRAVYSAYFDIPLSPGDPARVPADFPEQATEIAAALRRTGTYTPPMN